MKRYYLVTCLLLMHGLVQAQTKEFHIQGKAKGFNSTPIKMIYQGIGGKGVQDSAVVKDGTFEFKGQLDGPSMAYLMGSAQPTSPNDPNFTILYIEPGKMTMDVTAGDFKNLILKGSKTYDELTALNLRKKKQLDQVQVLSTSYAKANQELIEAKNANKSEDEVAVLKDAAEAAKAKMGPVVAEMEKIDMEYIKANPDSYYAASLLSQQISMMPLSLSKQLYVNLSDRVKHSVSGQKIAAEIKSLQGGSPGSVAHVFTAKDINGEQLNMADFKGKKYVLLDFWASWCVPCRKGNPHLISLYNKYKDKGLEIIGIASDDGNEVGWKKAVEQDKIGIWKHVMSGLKSKGAKEFDHSGDISQPYDISTLPTKILVDKNGIIIGRYGGGGEDDAAMDKKLAEIFGV